MPTLDVGDVASNVQQVRSEMKSNHRKSILVDLRLCRACLTPVEWSAWRRYGRWLGVNP